MQVYLFKGKKEKARSKDALLRKHGLKCNTFNYALVTKVKAVKP